MGRRVRMTEERRKAFLAALRRGATVAAAAGAAGVARSTAYAWRARDSRFAAAWDDAVEDGTDALEDVATRLAFAGNDRLLMFLLKARRPEKYCPAARTRRMAAGGAGTVSIEVRVPLPEPAPDECRAVPLGPCGSEADATASW